MSQKPKVVIVGGGFVGTKIAQDLDKDFNVVVLDKKKVFFNNIAALRPVVQPEFVARLFVPLDRALKNGKFVQAEVEEVRERDLLVRGLDKPVTFDYCVIATGSVYNFPGKVPWWAGTHAVRRLYNAANQKLVASQRIAIIGAGAVGLELAGEIKFAYPDKEVTVFHRGPYPLSSSKIGEKMGKYILTRLGKLGIKVNCNECIAVNDDEKNNNAFLDATRDNNKPDESAEDNVKTSDLAEAFSEKFLSAGERVLKSDSGKEFPVDCVFYCTGAHYACSAYEGNFQMTKGGRCITNDRLQAILKETGKPCDRVFVAGDCNGGTDIEGFGDPATLTFGYAHHPVVAKNIRAMNKGQSNTMAEFNSPDSIVCASLGPKQGFIAKGNKLGSKIDSQLFGPACLQDWIVKKVKSEDLFTNNMYKVLKRKEKPPKVSLLRGGKKGNMKSASVQPVADKYKNNDGF